MTVWFTSDNHFGHENIITYCDRPFANAAEMDEAMIELWNKRVKSDDVVYHLGDFSFRKEAETKAIVARLNGVKRLVVGNHDKQSKAWFRRMGFEDVLDEADLITFGYPVLLAHHPLYNQAAVAGKGCLYQLCGHVHNLWRRKRHILNIGVDVNDFKPVSLETVLRELEIG